MPASPSVARRLLDRLFVSATVTEVEPVGARMRRIRLAAPAIADLEWIPGQQVRVVVEDPMAWSAVRRGFRDVLRTYSVVDLSAQEAWLELRVLDHGDGPGARWSRTVAVGDPARFGYPEGKLVAQPAPFHLFVGEETASVAFGAVLAGLPADAAVAGVIEVAGEGDRMAIARGDALQWRYRGEASAASSSTLLAAVAALDLPDPPGAAYVAGEAKTCAAVRRHLVQQRGWPAAAVVVKPFWTPGKRGLE